MKKKLMLVCTLLLIGLIVPSVVFAQTDGLTTTQQVTMNVGGNSLIGVSGPNVVLSSSVTASEAGQSLLANSVDVGTRLRMSSYLEESGTFNKITAKVTSGDLYNKYSKLYLRLKAPTSTTRFINYANSGELKNQGNVTDAFTELTLPVDDAIIASSTYTPALQPEVLLVDGIGFCWTGAESGDGYVIEYSYAPMKGGTPQSAAVTVTYTITTY